VFDWQAIGTFFRSISTQFYPEHINSLTLFLSNLQNKVAPHGERHNSRV